jgi:ATP-dependent Clp protease adaptor protein ClpS
MAKAQNEDHDSENDAVVQVSKPVPKEPPNYSVILLNDDYTTMEFVVEVLEKFFSKTKEQALQIMLKVHQQGKGVAGVYTFEIAETKVVQVEEAASSRGFPLKCSLEKS